MSARTLHTHGESASRSPLPRLTGQKKGPNRALVAVLSIALLFALIGFAFHILWVITAIAIALWFGYAVITSRRTGKLGR